MRVISGKLKGRVIKGYDIDGTRPTMDRVKESIFAMIQNYLSGSVVLDLFSGSGNYGIEAISNGAKMVYFNDHNNKCIKVIKENLNNANIKEGKVLQYDYQEALSYFKKNNIAFDLVFLDPPYKEHIIENILDLLTKKNLLNNGALVICEVSKELEISNTSYELFKKRKYGDKKVYIYKLINNQ